MAELNEEHRTGVTIFSTELFVHYLPIKCLSVTEFQQLADTTNSLSSTCEVQRYMKSVISDMQKLFIADVLLWKFVTTLTLQNFTSSKQSNKPKHATRYPAETNKDLVELMQKSAVEHLTTFRQIQAREFDSVATIVTTDFEALYAYKRGDYQRCLQLSTQNVQTLFNTANVLSIMIVPEFIQLLDDDIVSLTALTLLINPECRCHPDYSYISQPTLSLYLMTRCQLKLRHSVESLSQTADYIRYVVSRYCPDAYILDRLTLLMSLRKIRTYMLDHVRFLEAECLRLRLRRQGLLNVCYLQIANRQSVHPPAVRGSPYSEEGSRHCQPNRLLLSVSPLPRESAMDLSTLRL